MSYSQFSLLIYKVFEQIDVARNRFLPLGLCGPVYTVTLITHHGACNRRKRK